MSEAAADMGSDELQGKFDKALELLQRDIVAAPSLYL